MSLPRILLGGLAALAALLTALPAADTAVAANSTVCNTYCDARDPSLAPKERVPVSTTVHSRTIALHIDDPDAMGWASIDNGGAGDEVWLDRSFDGGRTWASGSKLGDTTTPSGRQGWRTMMYNVDDWSSSGVGALRACGKAAGQSEIACTGWARSDWNAWDRRTAAATALMMLYDRGTGLFGTNGWWTSANALTAVIDNIRVSGMPSYRYAIATTYDHNINAQQGNFTNDYLDDTGWWGLAWIAAYDLTGDSRYLNTARTDADHMFASWTSQCGGGVVWNTNNTYKNAVTNELYLQLNAALHNRVSGDSVYLQRATQEWSWFKNSGLINSSNLINDGLNDTCQNNGQVTWTYNQGVVLGGLTELYRATGDSALLTTARRLADASTGSSSLNPAGVLTEPCEAGGCGADGPSFKGAYVRGLGVLNSQLSDHPYSSYLKTQADAAHARDRDSLDMYGLHWNGPFDGQSVGRQHSAVDLLNAAP